MDLKRNFRNSLPLSWSTGKCSNCYFIFMWKKINMQQSTVFWWKSKRMFPSKDILICSLKKPRVRTAGIVQSKELQNFYGCQLRVNFFVLLWVTLLLSQITLSVLSFCGGREILDSRSHQSSFGYLFTSFQLMKKLHIIANFTKQVNRIN